MKIATWNINSVRLRAPLVAKFAAETKPDVICLQEIKCRNGEFPEKAFREAGYPYLLVRGQKAYHGVAIASKTPIEELPEPDHCMRGEARVARGRVGGVEIHNYYVPSGGDIPDAQANDKFAHKLDFISRMTKWARKEKARLAKEPVVLVGDFNVAPFEHDVWSHKQLLDVVSHTPAETEGLATFLAAGGFTDVARALIPEPEKLYTWWSYRAKDWRASNRGRRLDHIWVSPALNDAALKGGRKAFAIHDHARDWEKCSDHAPVTLHFRA